MKNNKSIYGAIVACSTVLCSFSSSAEPFDANQNISVSVPYRVTPQVADDNFVYNPQTVSNRWEQYFKHPALRAHKETFTHWVGFHSVNPNLVLALMDMHSGILSRTSLSDVSRPFAELSNAQGFNEQLQDVLSRLSKSFYQVRKEQEQQYQDKGFVSAKQSAATLALQQLFATSQTPQVGKAPSEQLEQLLKTYEQRFEQSLQTQQPQFESLTQASLAAPVMQLPWSLGYSWIGGGSHGYDGSSWPHSSIDYAYDWPQWGGQTWSVRAAHGGTVSVLSSCQVRITDASGWATTYYHLSNVNVYNGQQVSANTHLGYYASNKSQALCEGGSSTGPHLHFSLLYNGYYQSLDGVRLSNYEVNTGRYSYDSDCNYFYYRDWNNGGGKFCGWRSMYNY